MKITKKLITEITEKLITDESMGELGWEVAAMAHEIVGYALEEFNARQEPVKIYRALSHPNSAGLRDVLGHFTGKPHDIAAYCGSEFIEVEETEIINVPSGYAAHRDNILTKRDRLMKEVDELNRRLKEKDV